MPIARTSLLLPLPLLILQNYYAFTPSPTHLLLALTLGTLWIPTFAFLALIAPSLATLTRQPNGTWRPRGLDTASAILLVVGVWWVSREADLSRTLEREFGVISASVWDRGGPARFSVVSAAGMSVGLVLALEVGKWVSLRLVPLFEGCRVLSWDTGVKEEAEERERVGMKARDGGCVRPEWGEGFW